MKVTVEHEFWQVFPEAQISVLNHIVLKKTEEQ